MELIPNFLKKYFWDVDFSDLNKKNHSKFIIERILEYGDIKGMNWMRKEFKLSQIKNVVQTSRNLSRKSANYWQIILGLNKDKVLCLKKSFLKKREPIWKY
jgi:hypothetical protein